MEEDEEEFIESKAKYDKNLIEDLVKYLVELREKKDVIKNNSSIEDKIMYVFKRNGSR